MTDRDAFIRAICEAPGDDTPRLVYADWLDEHGEPERAELIRVGVELARLAGNGTRCPMCDWRFRDDGGCRPGNCSFRPHPADSAYAEWKRRTQFRSQEQELLGHRHVQQALGITLRYDYGRPRLLGVAADGAATAWPCVVERGFVGAVEMKLADFLASAAAATRVSPFTACPITAVTITDQSPDNVITTGDADRWIFRRWPDADANAGRPPLPGYLPGILWDTPYISCEAPAAAKGRSPRPCPRGPRAFLSPEAAMAELSAACVSVGRRLAGLSPRP